MAALSAWLLRVASLYKDPLIYLVGIGLQSRSMVRVRVKGNGSCRWSGLRVTVQGLGQG